MVNNNIQKHQDRFANFSARKLMNAHDTCRDQDCTLLLRFAVKMNAFMALTIYSMC